MENNAVIVEVSGGMVNIIEKPQGIKVIIRDWDNATVEDDVPIPSEVVFNEEDVVLERYYI